MKADKQNWTKQELEDYERASIKERDEIGRIEFAERKAEKRGEMKGEKEKAIKIAKTMKDKGYPIDAIIELTELTKDEIENL